MEVMALFSTKDLMPHGQCFLWKPDLLGLHVLSDAIISLSYYVMPVAFYFYMQRKEEKHFKGIYYFFIVFFVLCGSSHLFGIITIWHPQYWVEGFIKAGTAIASLMSAVLIWKVMPKALAFPSPEKVIAINDSLKNEIKEKQRIADEYKHLSTQNELILKSAGEGIYGVDLKGVTTFSNPAAEKMLGYTFEEMQNKIQHDLIHHSKPDGKPYPRNACKIYAALSDGESHHVNNEFFWRKGDTCFPVEYVSTPIKEDGKIKGAVVIFKDITERKLSEEKLRLSEERFRTIFEEAPLGVALIDSLTGDIYEVNSQFAKIAGRTKEEMATIDWMSITHPDDVQEDLDNMEALNTGRISGFNMNKRYIKPDGSYVWINMTNAPVTVEDKTKPLHLCMIEDITQRKEFENELEAYRKNLKKLVDTRTDELKESLLRFKSYFELPLIGVAITSPQKGWIEVNQKLCEILGYSKEELFNMTWVELTHPDDVASDVAQFDRVESGEIEGYSISKRYIRKDKVVVFVELSVRCVRKSNGDIDYFVALINDISERVEAEKRVKETQAQLAHSDKLSSLGKLVGSVAHEFNNPLFGVTGIVDQLGDDLPVEDRKKLSSIGKKECWRMAGMIKNLQSFYKPSEGIETIIKMNNLVEDVLLVIGKDIKQKGIKLKRNFTDEVTVKAVEDQIKQVVINLLQNAADSISGDDGEILLTLESDSSNMILKVQDNGEGIPEDGIKDLFEPFFTTKGVKGTGLGLSVSYGIVKKHAGNIEVKSVLGQGSTFTVILPIKKSSI